MLKPVKGLDDDLEQNLESFCQQTHPRFELIVGAADPEDPALVVARRVKRRHPEVAMRIVSGEWPTGHNPKVRNLRHLLTKARYQAVLVSDGDVRVDPDYLRVMAAALQQPGTGLVSNLVVGVGALTTGAACENLQLNGFVAGCVAAADLLAKHPVVVGKSMLFRRDALTNAGGFAAAANVLAEDYLLGRAVAEAGYRVVTLGYPIRTCNRRWSLERMVRRHVRWSQIRRHVAPPIFALEPLAQPVLWALLLLLSCLFETSPLSRIGANAILASLMSLLTTVLDGLVVSRITGEPFTLSKLWLSPLKTVLALVAWLRAWVDPIVTWRDQRYRIGPGSRLSPVERRGTIARGSRMRWPAAA